MAHFIGYIAFGICLLLLGCMTLCILYLVANSLIGSLVDWLKTASISKSSTRPRELPLPPN